MSSLKYWVWLSSLNGIGPVTAAALLRHFGTPENIYTADAADYWGIDGVKQTDISRLMNKEIGEANKTLASCAQTGCRVLTQQDADYPERLRNIFDPPIVLYVKGNLPVIDDEPVVAIVGTRNSTPYGIKAAENAGYALARHNIVVVTGLARGIDSAAARAALRGGGRVVGVIGSGTDVVYPPENKALFDNVVGSGAIISEYPPGTVALPSHFPARNRIISGLSLGVAVIEAPKKSGAMITAARALEQGRDVFALPANVDARNSEGSNSLLREGAIPVLTPEDIIAEYAELFPDIVRRNERNGQTSQMAVSMEEIGADAGYPDSTSRVGDAKPAIETLKKEIDNQNNEAYIDVDRYLSALTGDDKTVAESIGLSKMLVDDIVVKTGLPAQRVLTALTMLEIGGYAVQTNGQYSLCAK